MGKCNNKLALILTSGILTSTNCLGPKNLAAAKAAMSFLTAANISYSISFISGQENRVAALFLAIFVTPTTTLTKIYQLEEGVISGGF